MIGIIIRIYFLQKHQASVGRRRTQTIFRAVLQYIGTRAVWQTTDRFRVMVREIFFYTYL